VRKVTSSPEKWPNVSSAREIASWLLDMDGVLVKEDHPIEGATRFLDLLRQSATPFLVLTNNSIWPQSALKNRQLLGDYDGGVRA